MDQSEAFKIAKEYAKIVIENVNSVNKIVLYGSCAKGTMHEDSDIDVAVIVDSIKGNYLDARVKLFRLKRDLDDRIEPILLINKDDPSDFLPHVLSTGKILFDMTKGFLH